MQTLALRAELLARTRAWFAARGIVEVETASLSAAATPDPAIHSMRAAGEHHAYYLHTSPEYMMKRLLADGAGDVWQLSRVYRDGEIGRWHEPEFMLLEWYRVGYDEHALMDDVESLLTELLTARRLRERATRMTYDEALHDALGLTSAASCAQLADSLSRKGVHVPERLTHTEMLDLAMSTAVTMAFDTGRLTFVHDYPAEQAALAQLNPGTPPTAARFEVFLGSLEIGNGFRELTDGAEQRARLDAENAARELAGARTVPLDHAFLDALDDGMPQSSGVAVGFDRVVAAALGAESLAEVVAFTHTQVSL